MTGSGASGSIVSAPSVGAPLDFSQVPGNRPLCRQFVSLADGWPIGLLAALSATIDRPAPAH
jgi:hypothetical protein